METHAYDVLVIGAGISGMHAALDLADQGFKVLVVERQASIGGTMVKLDKTFPTNDCAICIAAPKMVELARHPNITLLTSAQVERVSGSAGNFEALIWRQATYVDPEKCTGCGDCAQACPVEVDDMFNGRLSRRKAIYLQFPQAVPAVYTIDYGNCVGCGACDRACAAGAIAFLRRSRPVTATVSSIIVATGFETLEPTQIRKEYGYGRYPNVLTAIQYERLLSASGPTGGVVARPSDGRHPRRVAWIQCVGSRSVQGGYPYCSKICCMYATKEALITLEHAPDTEATIFYMDLRAYGKDFQQFYHRAAGQGVRYVRGRPAAVEEDRDRNLVVTYADTLGGAVRRERFDLLVLSTAIVPAPENRRLARALGIAVDAYGFFVPRDPLLDPLRSTREGIFLAGGAQGPNDIPDCVAQASGAAALAAVAPLARMRANGWRQDQPAGAPPVTLPAAERGACSVPDGAGLHADGAGTPQAQAGAAGVEEESSAAGVETPRVGVLVCGCGKNISGFVEVPAITEAARQMPGVAFAEACTFACSEDVQRRIRAAIAGHGLNRLVVAACSPITHGPLFQQTCAEAGLNPGLFEMANIRNQCSWVHSFNPGPATAKAVDLVRMAVARAGKSRELPLRKVKVIPSCLVIGGGVAGITAAITLADLGIDTFLVERGTTLGGKLNTLATLDPGDVPASVVRDQLMREVQRRPQIRLFLGTEVREVSGHIGDFRVTLDEGPGGMLTELRVGAIIVATGFREADLRGRFGYGTDPRVITQLELEASLREGTLGAPRTVVMINCAGSMDAENPACCRIGCGIAVKNARMLHRAAPGARIVMLYQDMRVYGSGQEEAFTRMLDEVAPQRVRYAPDRPPQVTLRDGRVVVLVHDSLLDEELAFEADLVVLTAALRGDADTSRLKQLLKVATDAQGFYREAHAKIRPLDFNTDGIYLCGADHYPRSVPDTIAQAAGAASRAAIPLLRGQVSVEPNVAEVAAEACAGCGLCVPHCPYGALQLDPERRIARVEEVQCKGCGTCVAACPSGALQQRGFSDEQLLAMIEAAWEEPAYE
ncbi:MAG: CoB--CoM heterodisulfide reductase iron-sulfur subunit A family protein [Oscillochloridaceae bacterium]|nr:CoB--CoM heterodisulfide reductase iron-sulfur subunit A family protein [Chloroflexaceae bacterium]MDW8391834.1 CoB--CoM heterodisulfide reductase iron-sulfur subunit A family protein [Oscillochloridaceae bacterium]